MMIKSLVSAGVVLAVAAAPAFGQAGANDPNRNPTGSGQHDMHKQPGQTAQPGQPGQPGQRPGMDSAMPGQRNEFDQQLARITDDPNKLGDRLFVLKASMANTCEVDLARRAMQKTQDAEVRRLSQQLIDDHQKANESLAKAAQELNVELIRNVPPFKQKEAEALTALPEQQFKQAYLSHLKAGHAAAICAYQDQAVLSQNEAVKQYVNETLPHLKHHGQIVSAAARGAGLPALVGVETGELPDRR